jgi:hypothetical protein
MLLVCVQLGAFTYHICENANCSVIYRGDIKELKACPLCDTPRYAPATPATSPKARKKVVYMSIKGFIQYLFSSADIVQALCWWSSEQRDRHRDSDYSNDVYDSELWQLFASDQQMQARGQHAVFDSSFTGINLAFCGCTDGASPFDKKAHTITPIALACFNLPPWIRHTLAAMHICCIIPGRSG